MANDNGTLNLNFYHNTEEEGKNWAKETIDLAHKSNCKALLMLGGEGNGKNILNSMKNHKNEFILSLTKTINELNFDGIDLDWEDDIDDNLIIELAKELRNKLPNKIITIPGYTININGSIIFMVG